MRVRSLIGVLVVATAASVGFASSADRAGGIDQDSASGTNPAVFVSGESRRPKLFRVKLESSPSEQQVGGSASLSCRDKHYNFTDRTRPVDAVTPAIVELAPTKRRAKHCSVAVSAGAEFRTDDVYFEGLLEATLSVTRKPRG